MILGPRFILVNDIDLRMTLTSNVFTTDNYSFAALNNNSSIPPHCVLNYSDSPPSCGFTSIIPIDSECFSLLRLPSLLRIHFQNTHGFAMFHIPPRFLRRTTRSLWKHGPHPHTPTRILRRTALAQESVRVQFILDLDV
jgi:hypothetical protein